MPLGGGRRLMAKTILNFHFDYLTPSLMINFNLIIRVSNWTNPFRTKIQLFTLLNYLKRKAILTKGSLAMEKYGSKLTSLQEKLEVFAFHLLVLFFLLGLSSSKRIPVNCFTQVWRSAQNTLGRPFLGWARLFSKYIDA